MTPIPRKQNSLAIKAAQITSNVSSAKPAPAHYLLRVGDGADFLVSRPHKLWGIISKWKTFLQTVNPGDILWFVRNKRKGDDRKGRAIGVATYVGHRQLPDDVRVWLGWHDKYEIAIDYTDMYDLSGYDTYTEINGQAEIRPYKPSPELLNLPEEYRFIVKYCRSL